jgi:hypothetical protein
LSQSSTHLIKTISEEKAELKVKGLKVKMTSKIDGDLNFIKKNLF